jgi:APA family basic amino acid/polyamine antiporter
MAQATPRPRDALVRGLGPIATTALVAGNMIGSGIFVVPAALADVAGPAALLAWGLVAAGFLCLVAVYADLAGAYPISGGLQVYAQRAFGDLAGLEVAFLYWASVVIANAAYMTAFVSYVAEFAPAARSPIVAFGVAQALLWALTLVNVIGVRLGGIVQTATTLLKIAPLLVLSVALLAAGSPSNLVPFAPKGYAAILPASSFIAWLFLGSESATIPAEEVKGGAPTIRRASYSGFALAVAVYALLALAVTFGAPASEIAGDASPLATLARRVLGPGGGVFVSLGALVSIAGILNGSLLIAGRLPFAAARQGIAPAVLGRVGARTGTPVVSLLVCGVLSAALVSLYFSKSLLDAYNLIALASTCTALVAIAATCAARLALARRDPERFPAAARRRGRVAALVGLVVVLLMIAGAGGTVAALTAVVIVLPLPYYVLGVRRRTETPGKAFGG